MTSVPHVDPTTVTILSPLPHTRFYVYELVAPNGRPFYVGKGRGLRIFAHEVEARGGCKCHKCRVIRAIWANDTEFERRIVFTTDNEQEAYEVERDIIAHYGVQNLSNCRAGGQRGEMLKQNHSHASTRVPIRLTITRMGMKRCEFAHAVDVSVASLDALDKKGFTPEVTAWRIARGFGELTHQTTKDAYEQLFVEGDESALMRVKARDNFASILARAGLTRPAVAKVAGLSARTLDVLARPSGDRKGFTREATAWRIARGFGELTQQTTEDAYGQLFVEVDESEPTEVTQ